MNTKLSLIATSIIATFVILTYYSYVSDLPFYNDKSEVPTADLDCGFTDDFKKFLNDNGYGSFSFDRPDIKCGAYGGRATNKE
jgi:hypothetical protein